MPNSDFLQRANQLESLFTHLEKTVQDLDEVVIDGHQQFEELKQRVERLERKVATVKKKTVKKKTTALAHESKSGLKGGTRLVILATLLYWVFLFVWTQSRALISDFRYLEIFRETPIELFLDYAYRSTFELVGASPRFGYAVSYAIVLICAVVVPLFFLGLAWLIRWTIRGFKSSGF